MASPGSRAPEILGTYSLFVALTTIFVAMRVYTRALLVKNLGLDDWLAVISWILFIVFASFAITGTYHGNGQHVQYIDPPSEISVGLKWWWACEPVYVLCNIALKSSIAVMLLRLTTGKAHKIIIWATLAVVQLYSIFFFFLFVFQCRPSAYFWTQYTGGKGTCIDPIITVNATYGYSAISCVGDWIFSILPVFLVWDLKMNPRTKISVICILAMGAIASITTIIRIPYISSLKNQADFLYATADVAIWSCCETGVGIVACSAAALRPLFRIFLDHSKLFGSSGRLTNTGAWPAGVGSAGGYIRNRNDGAEEFGLKGLNGGRQGVTTYVGSGDNEKNGQDSKRENSRRRDDGSGSERKLTVEDQWSDKAHDRSSGEEEINWEHGIRKTMVTKQVVY